MCVHLEPQKRFLVMLADHPPWPLTTTLHGGQVGVGMVRATQVGTVASASITYSLGLPDASLGASVALTGAAPTQMTQGSIPGVSSDTKARPL